MKATKDLIPFLTNEGYFKIREIGDHGMCGIRRFIYTTGLCIGLEEHGYLGRYCFHTASEAEEALNNWDGIGDPPGNWIKYKGHPCERSNENYFGI